MLSVFSRLLLRYKECLNDNVFSLGTNSGVWLGHIQTDLDGLQYKRVNDDVVFRLQAAASW